MKIKISQIIIVLLCFYLIFGIYLLDASFESILRIFRFITLPILILITFALIPKIKLIRLKKLIWLGLPILILFFINLLQLVAIPKDAIEMHITGSIKFTAWFGTYLCSLLSLNPTSALQYKKYISNVLLTIFLIGVAIYPIIMISSGISLSTVLAGYGAAEDRVQNSGIFGSANEDANGLMTLFPIALVFLEQVEGNKKIIFKFVLFSFFPFLLLYNGTRTTLFLTLPVILVLFYSKLSLKGLVRLLLMGATPLLLSVPFISTFIDRAFASNTGGKGDSYAWRLTEVWTPAIEYTEKYSPIFGFGSRGWEYISEQLGLLTQEGLPLSTHSGYIWAFVSWGALGLLAYILFIIVLLIESFRLSQLPNTELSTFGRALFCSVFAYCIWAYISNVFWAQGWVILVSLATLIATTKIIASTSPKFRIY